MGLRSGRRSRQQGVVAVIVAFALFAMVALMALVVDAGRMYMLHARLQIAADACALAGVQQLDNTAGGLERAQAAGRSLAARNIDAQGVLPAVQVTVTWGDSLWPAPEGSFSMSIPPAQARYVRCEVAADALTLVGQLFDRGALSLRATGTAENMPGLDACAIPLAVCAREKYEEVNVTTPASCQCSSGYSINVTTGSGKSATTTTYSGAWCEANAGANGACPAVCGSYKSGGTTYACSTVPSSTRKFLRSAGLAADASRNFGLYKGQWVSSPRSSNAVEFGPNATGNYNWASLYGENGAPALADELGRVCNIDLKRAETEGIGNTGLISSLERSWDTRFGVYQRNSADCTSGNGTSASPAGAPDWTGHSFGNYPSMRSQPDEFYTPVLGATNTPIPIYGIYDRKAGTVPNPGAPMNFQEARSRFLPAGSVGTDSCKLNVTEHQERGVNRRLVLLPVVRCSEWGKDTSTGLLPTNRDFANTNAQKAPVVGWMCGLIVDRVTLPQAPRRPIEILGPANAVGSPCGQSGVPTRNSIAGRVAALVQ